MTLDSVQDYSRYVYGLQEKIPRYNNCGYPCTLLAQPTAS